MISNLQWIVLPVELGVIAYVYSVVLTRPGMLLAPLVRAAYNWISSACNEEGKNRRETLLKPLLLCHVCVAGQMALWTLIAVLFNLHFVITLIDIAFFISFTILITITLHRYYEPE